MASTLVVPIIKLKNIHEHPNAHLLGLADALGYQVVVPLIETDDETAPIIRWVDENDEIIDNPASDMKHKHFKFKYTTCDNVVYFPADTILPDEWIEKFGVKAFMIGKDKNRVGKIKLRGEPSFGLIVDVPDELKANEGDNVAGFFNAKKYMPPIRATAGDAAKYDENIDPFVEKYTDIQNGKIYVNVFENGEKVYVSEKIHGTNTKIGIVNGHYIASSMGVRRKKPTDKNGNEISFDDDEMKRNTYWYPWTINNVKEMIEDLSKNNNIVLIYGEVYGNSIQKNFTYDTDFGHLGFKIFDIMLNGKYLDYYDFKNTCDKYCVETVPTLYVGGFDFNIIKELSDGKSTLALAEHIREGVVVKPIKERSDNKIGRVVLKYIGTEYELSKHKKNDTTDI